MMHYVQSIVLYTTMDAQCDKLETVISRTKLTTHAMVDIPWQNLSKSQSSGQSFRGKYPYFWRYKYSLISQCRI